MAKRRSGSVREDAERVARKAGLKVSKYSTAGLPAYAHNSAIHHGWRCVKCGRPYDGGTHCKSCGARKLM